MWTRSYSLETNEVTKEQMWRLFSNVNDWHLWDDGIEYAKIEGNFLKGNFFELKPKGGPKVKIELLETIENKMFLDLSGFFGVSITPDTKYLSNVNFADGIVQNKNARILYDKDGNIVMMYVFADDNSIIITNSENATQEIMLRLAASQIKK